MLLAVNFLLDFTKLFVCHLYGLLVDIRPVPIRWPVFRVYGLNDSQKTALGQKEEYKEQWYYYESAFKAKPCKGIRFPARSTEKAQVNSRADL